MDLVHASESLLVLSNVMEIALAMLGTVCAIASGALLAFKLSPFDPSTSETMEAHDRYVNFQAKLAHVRARRHAMCMADAYITRESRANEPTKLNCDNTIPDLRLAESFSVVPVRTVHVGGVQAQRVLQVG